MTQKKGTQPKGRSTGTKKTAPAKAKAADPVTEPSTKVEESGGSKLPGYLNKRDLSDKDRHDLIKDFNESFDAQFDNRMKEPKVLKTMQNRLKTQKYEK